jgi:predicted alpha/beta superfamily hydrolase
MSKRRRGAAYAAIASILGLSEAAFYLRTAPTVANGHSIPAATQEVPRGEVSIPNSRRVDFVSKVNGHRYSISVALPFEPAPARGYGVLYVLDGYNYFASATEAARGHANAPEGVVVVGIGYPDDPAFVQSVLARRGPAPAGYDSLPPSRAAPQLERYYDLTLPASDQELAEQTVPGTPALKSENVGGLDDFLKTIETDVKPRVAALASVDSTNQALFGHSLGGLAVLHALFVEPNSFRTFIIASPSIWWNKKAVLADEATFMATVNAGRANPRVLITVGSEESTAPKRPASWKMDPAAIEAAMHRLRMVENVADLVEQLKALHASDGQIVEDYAVFDKQNHTISPWPALARGIPFAFPPSR